MGITEETPDHLSALQDESLGHTTTREEVSNQRARRCYEHRPGPNQTESEVPVMASASIPKGECPDCHVPNLLLYSMDGLFRLPCAVAQQPLKQKDDSYCVLCRRRIQANQDDAVDVKHGRAHLSCVFPGLKQ